MTALSSEPFPLEVRVALSEVAHSELVTKVGAFAASAFVAVALTAHPDERGALVATTSARALARHLGVAKDTGAGALAILVRRGYLRRLTQWRVGGRFAHARYVVRPPAGFEVIGGGDPARPCPPSPDTLSSAGRRRTPDQPPVSARRLDTRRGSDGATYQLGLFAPTATVTDETSAR